MSDAACSESSQRRVGRECREEQSILQQSVMSSTINLAATTVTMSHKSKKIFAKRFDDDFDRVSGELGIVESVSIEEASNLLVALGFIKLELRQVISMDSKLIDQLLSLVKAPSQDRISLHNLRQALKSILNLDVTHQQQQLT